MKNIIAIFLILLGLELNAQQKKLPEIMNFSIDSTGVISWEIKHYERELSYQIEGFYNGKWLVFNTSKESITIVLKDQKEEFVNKDKFSLKENQVGYLYRLRITDPTTLISKEVEYKK